MSAALTQSGDLDSRIATLRAAYPMLPIREQFGRSLLRLAEARPDVVAITADLMWATGMQGFGDTMPERLVNVGIAEQNMTGVAAGLASCGKLPVVCGYAAFTTLRAVEQAKTDCAYNEAKVILAGLSAGLAYGVGGPTHQTFEDLAIMRAIPNMIVLAPADAHELDSALQAAAEHEAATPIYIRAGRGPEHVVSREGDDFTIGRAKKLRDGADLCLVATGHMVAEAVIAADLLREEGIAASVLNMHTIKPIDREAILAEAARVRGMIVIEEHNVMGGLGSAVLEVLRRGHAFPVEPIGIEDAYPPIGPHHALRASLGLSAAEVVRRARVMLG